MKNNKGITLVALVVTIVVLLILAGVSINLVLGDNGIVKKAQEAKNKTIEDQANMQAGMDSLAGEIGEAIGELVTTPETAPYLPDDTFSKVEGTIDTGLVIQDASGNEYVWVVVPRTTEVYKTIGLGKTTFTDEDYTSIEKDLKDYTSTYITRPDFSDTWYADTNNEGWLTETEYNTLKNDMLKSVYENGGFYVGRYEAGIGTNRNSPGPTNSDGKYTIEGMPTPLSKADAYPYTWVTRTQAQKLANNVNSGSRTSSLMFGLQWDLVLTFMSKDTAKVTNTDILTLNSKTIGNYEDNLWTITNENAKYSTNSGSTFIACPNPYKKESSSSILLTTGADSSFSVQNIYDIAGNVGELTLENTSYSTPCAERGGTYVLTGLNHPAADRSTDGTNYRFSCTGFRVSLF